MTAEQYYNRKSPKLSPKVPNSFDFEIPNLYFISGFSHPRLPIITSENLVLKQWGLIPSWVGSKENALEIQDKTLNAKGETIFEKPSFRQNILSRRCLLPVSGFFEWREYNHNKYPYFIQPSNDHGFLIGSIFDTWVDIPSGEIFDTFSMVTTEANPLMEMIHNTKKRMPLILDYDAADLWLNPLSTPSEINEIITPYNENNMKAHTISKEANSPRLDRNFKEILEPITYPELNQQSLF